MTAFKTIMDDLMDRSTKALRSTAPIYRRDEYGRLELFGSGVFFRYESQHFVVSAGHVLAELRDREIRIGGENQAIPLTGRFFHTGRVGETTFENESFDIAFAPLSQEQVSALDGTVFLTMNDIEPAGSPVKGARYNAVGFIAKDYKVVGSKQPVEAKGTALLAKPAPPEKYRERRVGEDSHLLLSFDRFKTYSMEGQQATPQLYGMSGCGIWRVGNPDTLAAILTEHHQENKKFIVSTRIQTVVSGLADYVAGKL